MNKNVFLTGLTLAVIINMSACGPKTTNRSVEIGNTSTPITTAIQTVATITNPITNTAVTVTPLPTTTTPSTIAIVERNIVYANGVVEYSKPSLKKKFKALSTGKAKRSLKKAVVPGYGKKGLTG